MKISEAVSIARLLGVPADDVMRHAGVQIESQFEQVPLICWVDGAGEVHMDPDSTATVPHPGGGLRYWPQTPRSGCGDIRDLPRLRPGDGDSRFHPDRVAGYADKD